MSLRLSPGVDRKATERAAIGESKQQQLQPPQGQPPSTLRHSLTVPAGFHGNQKRFSTPNLTRDALRNMDAYDGPVPLMKAFSTVPHEGLSARSPVWTEVQSALIGAFKGRANPNLGRTAQLVRLLAKSVSTSVVFEYLETKLLTKGFKILGRRLDRNSEDPEELLESLESVWQLFYVQLVPEVKCVFQPMGMDLQTLERALMLGFRDQVLLPTQAHEILRSEAASGRGCSVSPGLKQMLLVLQMYRDAEPPSKGDVALERMVALAVKPYIGFLGVYNGSEEPEHRANVSALVKTRRRLTRRAFISRNSLFRSDAAGAAEHTDADSLAIVLADDEYSDREEEEDEERQEYDEEVDEEEENEVQNEEGEREAVKVAAQTTESATLELHHARGRFSSEPNVEISRVFFV